jgi:hypothetical protein
LNNQLYISPTTIYDDDDDDDDDDLFQQVGDL